MRTRDEVLRDAGLQLDPRKGTRIYEDAAVYALADAFLSVEQQRDAMADRIAQQEARIRELEAQQAASEPVAWGVVSMSGILEYHAPTKEAASKHMQAGDSLRPLVFGDVAHPSTAAVTVTEAMVREAHRLASVTWAQPECTETLYSLVAHHLTAALTAASEVQPCDDDTCTGCNGTGYNATRERPCDCRAARERREEGNDGSR